MPSPTRIPRSALHTSQYFASSGILRPQPAPLQSLIRCSSLLETSTLVYPLFPAVFLPCTTKSRRGVTTRAVPCQVTHPPTPGVPFVVLICYRIPAQVSNRVRAVLLRL